MENYGLLRTDAKLGKQSRVFGTRGEFAVIDRVGNHPDVGETEPLHRRGKMICHRNCAAGLSELFEQLLPDAGGVSSCDSRYNRTVLNHHDERNTFRPGQIGHVPYKKPATDYHDMRTSLRHRRMKAAPNAFALGSPALRG